MFNENDRRNIIVATIMVLALTVACAATVQFYKSAVPEHVEHSTINITTSDYEQALAKWNALAVKEYEIVIHSASDDVTLRVNVPEASVDILEHLHSGSPLGETIPTNSALLRRVTVERLFQLAKEGLDVMRDEASSGLPPGKQDAFLDYSVRFDQERGYPTYLSKYARITRSSREVVWRETPQEPIEVRSLKVIK
jgi:hypothetical protein